MKADEKNYTTKLRENQLEKITTEFPIPKDIPNFKFANVTQRAVTNGQLWMLNSKSLNRDRKFFEMQI